MASVIGSRSSGDLLAGHRHRDLLVLGHHVLAQPGPAGLAGLGADPQLLLGAGHRRRRWSGRRCRGRRRGLDRRTSRSSRSASPSPVACRPVSAAPVSDVPASGRRRRGRAVADAVVAVELLLLLRRQVAVLGDVRRVLHLSPCRRPRVTRSPSNSAPCTGTKRLVGAEQAGVHGDPLRLVGVVVVVDRADLADLVAVPVVRGGSDDGAQLVLGSHLNVLLRVGTSTRRSRSGIALRRKRYLVRPGGQTPMRLESCRRAVPSVPTRWSSTRHAVIEMMRRRGEREDRAWPATQDPIATDSRLRRLVAPGR